MLFHKVDVKIGIVTKPNGLFALRLEVDNIPDKELATVIGHKIVDPSQKAIIEAVGQVFADAEIHTKMETVPADAVVIPIDDAHTKTLQ
jgi:hypothetical protein